MKKQMNDSKNNSQKNLLALKKGNSNIYQNSNDTDIKYQTNPATQKNTDAMQTDTKKKNLTEKDIFLTDNLEIKGCAEAYLQGNPSQIVIPLENNNINGNEINIDDPSTNAPKDNIKVAARIRPRNEMENGLCNKIEVIGNMIKHKDKPDDVFTFDYVAEEQRTQEEMFLNCAKEVADNVLEGYNGTIFAYGQTSAGKTFTLVGPKESLNRKLPPNSDSTNLTEQNIMKPISEQKYNQTEDFKKKSDKRGIIPRVIEYIIKVIEEKKKNKNITISLCCSFLEIYNEQLRDLLDIKNTNKTIDIWEIEPGQEEKLSLYKNNNFNKNVAQNINKDFDKKINNEPKIITINGLLKKQFDKYEDAIDCLSRGMKSRVTGQTNMNDQSSRSHAIFSIWLESVQKSNDRMKTKKSVFHMVDLAGCERQSHTGATGVRLFEAGQINKSLGALKKVLESLDPANKQVHVPYRDSKLTLALKDSLGGNSKTCIIVNLSPANINDTETVSTLQFGVIAKKVKNEAKINEEILVENPIESLKLEKERNFKLTRDNAKLIERQKNQKIRYEELYKQYLICSKKIESFNDNQMDFGDDQSNNQFDPKFVFEDDHKPFNNNNMSNENKNRNLHFNNNNQKIPKAINDDSTRDDYMITYDNCFKELERLQEVLSDNVYVIENLKSKNAQQEKTIDMLNEHIEELTRKNSDLRKEFNEGDSNLTTIMLENTKLEKEIKNLNIKIQENIIEIQRNKETIAFNEMEFNKKLESAKRCYESECQKLQIIQEDKNRIEKTLKAFEVEMEKKVTKIKELNEAIDESKRKKEELEKAIIENSNAFKKKEIEVQYLKDQIAETNQRGKELMKNYELTLSKKDKQNEDLEDELRNQKNNFSNLEMDSSNVKHRYCRLNDELTEEIMEKKKLSTENNQLRTQLTDYILKEQEWNQKEEELTNTVSELTKNKNEKAINAIKISLIEKQKMQINELKNTVENLRIKETSFNNIVSKLRITDKTQLKNIQADQIEKFVSELAKQNERYNEGIIELYKKVDFIIYNVKTNYSHCAFFFDNEYKYNNIFNKLDELDLLIKKFDSINAFIQHTQDLKNKIKEQEDNLLNINKSKAKNNSNSLDLINQDKNQIILRNQNEERADKIDANNSKESQKRSSIIDKILKPESCSNINKALIFGSKRKSSASNFMIPSVENYNEQVPNFINPMNSKTNFNINICDSFAKIMERNYLTKQTGPKDFEGTNNNVFINREKENAFQKTEYIFNFPDTKKSNTADNHNIFDLRTQTKKQINESKNNETMKINISENFMGKSCEDNSINNDDDNKPFKEIPEEKIDNVNSSLNKMDIVN